MLLVSIDSRTVRAPGSEKLPSSLFFAMHTQDAVDGEVAGDDSFTEDGPETFTPVLSSLSFFLYSEDL